MCAFVLSYSIKPVRGLPPVHRQCIYYGYITKSVKQVLRLNFISNCPRFDGFGQHDSHDALRYLLGALREEELKRWQKAILDNLNNNSQVLSFYLFFWNLIAIKNINCVFPLQLIDPSDDYKKQVKAWGRATGLATTVDRIFAGIILSSLTCEACQTVCQHFEIFLDLSLPIVDIESSNLNQNKDYRLNGSSTSNLNCWFVYVVL